MFATPRIARYAVALVALALSPSDVSAQSLPHFTLNWQAECPKRDMRVTLFADGSLRDAAEQSGEATGSGSVGITVGMETFLVGAKISIASSLAEVTEGFGTTMLAPNTGSNGTSAIFEVALPDIITLLDDEPHWGTSGYVFLQQARWVRPMTDEDDMSMIPASADVNLVGAGAFFYHAIQGESDGQAETRNTGGLSFGLGPALRWVGGEADAAFRQAVFQETDRAWGGGLEGFLAITVDRITAFSHFYVFKADGIPGVDGLNAVFGIDIRGNVFRGDFRRR